MADYSIFNLEDVKKGLMAEFVHDLSQMGTSSGDWLRVVFNPHSAEIALNGKQFKKSPSNKLNYAYMEMSEILEFIAKAIAQPLVGIFGEQEEGTGILESGFTEKGLYLKKEIEKAGEEVGNALVASLAKKIHENNIETSMLEAWNLVFSDVLYLDPSGQDRFSLDVKQLKERHGGRSYNTGAGYFFEELVFGKENSAGNSPLWDSGLTFQMDSKVQVKGEEFTEIPIGDATIQIGGKQVNAKGIPEQFPTSLFHNLPRNANITPEELSENPVKLLSLLSVITFRLLRKIRNLLFFRMLIYGKTGEMDVKVFSEANRVDISSIDLFVGILAGLLWQDLYNDLLRKKRPANQYKIKVDVDKSGGDIHFSAKFRKSSHTELSNGERKKVFNWESLYARKIDLLHLTRLSGNEKLRKTVFGILANVEPDIKE